MRAKRRNTAISNIGASVLAGVYGVYWLLLSLHHIIALEHRHERETCHAAPGETHIHSKDYAAVDCSICQIAPSIAELPPIGLPLFQVPVLVPYEPVFAESVWLPSIRITLAQPRAPPIGAMN